VGSAAEWGECGGDDGEDIEWEGAGSCELLSACFYPICFQAHYLFGRLLYFCAVLLLMMGMK
jgi:hypothetical protein